MENSEPIEAYHATRSLQAIMADGAVRPFRLPNVYLFSLLADANDYAAEFKYEAVITVTYLPKHMQRRWKPSYCHSGFVIKLKPGKTAIVASENVVFILPTD